MTTKLQATLDNSIQTHTGLVSALIAVEAMLVDTECPYLAGARDALQQSLEALENATEMLLDARNERATFAKSVW